MALHSVDLSLLHEWDSWSRLAPEKYEAGACAEKWKTFDASRGITLGSLIHWAQEDGWIPPSGSRREKTQKQPEPPPQPQTVTPEQHVLVILDHLRQSPHHARTLARILRDADIGERSGSY
jgi:primase-like protein